MYWPLLADALNRDLIDKEHLFSGWHAPLIVCAGAGFIAAVAGHLFQSRTLVASGITLIFIAVLLFPLILYIRGAP